MDLIKKISNDLIDRETCEQEFDTQIKESFQQVVDDITSSRTPKLLTETLNIMLDRVEAGLGKIKTNPNVKSSKDVLLLLSALEAMRQERLKGPHLKDILDDASKKTPGDLYVEITKGSPNVTVAIEKFADKLQADLVNNGGAVKKLIGKLRAAFNQGEVKDPFKHTSVR